MALIQWGKTPFNSMERVMLGAMRRPASFEELVMPTVDLSEDDENYYIISELRGMRDDDVNVTINADLLTISGKSAAENIRNYRKHHHNELTVGQFVRSFSIPRNVKAEAISGTFRDGLLELTLPKVAKTMPPTRDIPLGSASANSGVTTAVASATPARQEKPEARVILA